LVAIRLIVMWRRGTGAGGAGNSRSSH